MIWTDYRARVVEALRGSRRPGETLTLSFAGGSDAGRTVRIAGVPRLEPGSQYLVFLDDAPARPVPAAGWGQGIFRLGRSGADEAFVSLDGERLTVGREGVLARARAAAPPASQSLAAPIARNADGTPAVLGLAAPRTSAAASPRSASRAEIRRFVRGSFGGRPAAAQTP